MDGSTAYYLGADLGTGGVRVLAVTASGKIAARRACPVQPLPAPDGSGAHEQQPEEWWKAFCSACAGVIEDLRRSRHAAPVLRGIAVDGTSGTVAVLDADGRALRPALMYNDARSAPQAASLNAACGDYCSRMGYAFGSSFALPKIAWLRDAEPQVYERAAHFVHHADYIAGRLTGRFGISDYSNALKTGYDLFENRWPDWIRKAVPGAVEKLPEITYPGDAIGHVQTDAAAETGLPQGLTVFAGASDGSAAFLASGARRPGDHNVTLGTTLVFKTLAEKPCVYPGGIIYSHKLPGGYWLPGAASNTGGEWAVVNFAGENLDCLTDAAAGLLPCASICYPLARRGERFPFACETAETFCTPEPDSREGRFAAHLQGMACVERLACQVLENALGGGAGPARDGAVFATGGGSLNDAWTQTRADVLGRPIHRPACPDSAFGAAVLAAAGDSGQTLLEAIAAMVRAEKTFEPRNEFAARYNDLFSEFCGEIRRRGWM